MFVQISDTVEPLYIGVVNKPPGGCKCTALAEFEKMLTSLPHKRIIILGDFSDDLFKPECKKFESTISEHYDMIPMI